MKGKRPRKALFSRTNESTGTGFISRKLKCKRPYLNVIGGSLYITQDTDNELRTKTNNWLSDKFPKMASSEPEETFDSLPSDFGMIAHINGLLTRNQRLHLPPFTDYTRFLFYNDQPSGDVDGGLKEYDPNSDEDISDIDVSFQVCACSIGGLPGMYKQYFLK